MTRRHRWAALAAATTFGALACAVTTERAAARAPDPPAEEPMTASVTSSLPQIDLNARQVRAQTATFALG